MDRLNGLLLDLEERGRVLLSPDGRRPRPWPGVPTEEVVEVLGNLYRIRLRLPHALAGQFPLHLLGGSPVADETEFVTAVTPEVTSLEASINGLESMVGAAKLVAEEKAAPVFATLGVLIRAAFESSE